MAEFNIDKSLALSFKHEGGYVNNPKDPGGPTNHGITMATLAAHRKRPVTIAEVRALSKGEARDILYNSYLKPIRFDELPSGLDHSVADFAINSGPSRAVKVLQKLVGTAPDGIMGPKTITAAQLYARSKPGGVEALIQEYNAQRMAFLKRLKTWGTFGRGWTIRVTGKDPKGLFKGSLGVVGESLAMHRNNMTEAKLEQLPELNVETGKARDVDIAVTSTPTGKAGAIGVFSAIAVMVNKLLESLTEYSAFEYVQYAIIALTIVSAIVTLVITINNMREAGANA